MWSQKHWNSFIGVNPVEVRGSRTGVYYALSVSDADTYWSETEDRANGIGLLGSCKSLFANRISFHFDFSGKYVSTFILHLWCSEVFFGSHCIQSPWKLQIWYELCWSPWYPVWMWLGDWGGHPTYTSYLLTLLHDVWGWVNK